MDVARTLFGTLNAAAELGAVEGDPGRPSPRSEGVPRSSAGEHEGLSVAGAVGLRQLRWWRARLGMTATGGDLVRGEPDVIQSAKSFKGFRSVAGEVRRLLGQAV